MEGGEEGEGTGLRSKKTKEGEVDYKSKSGTAWSHSYLNQKPWHPLSYPNQRRKWIAEQSHATRERRVEEVAREYAQEQEFFRQTALISSKEKEKLEIMKAVSFMYVRPPGYNAESAKAAEIADSGPKDLLPEEQPALVAPPQKNRPKDVFGRSLPTEEEFEVLKNAPKLETGVAGRVKPFGVEIRNVKCLRCGAHGHQSGDRECSLRDAIMPNEETRLRRDDPLTAILVHTDPAEPLKWELKQKPGMSPPRGGFKPDDPNQQIVAEDVFDEYGGFLGESIIPELLTNFSRKPKKKSSEKSTHRNHKSEFEENKFSSPSSSDGQRRPQKRDHKKKRKKRHRDSASSSSDVSKPYKHRRSKSKHNWPEEFDTCRRESSGKNRRKRSYSSEDSDAERSKYSKSGDGHYRKKRRHGHFRYYSSRDSKHDERFASKKGKEKRR